MIYSLSLKYIFSYTFFAHRRLTTCSCATEVYNTLCVACDYCVHIWNIDMGSVIYKIALLFTYLSIYGNNQRQASRMDFIPPFDLFYLAKS